MEDTHGEKEDGQKGFMVLILIIMEDTHGERINHLLMVRFFKVLILIIMEDTHGGISNDLFIHKS